MLKTWPRAYGNERRACFAQIKLGSPALFKTCEQNRCMHCAASSSGLEAEAVGRREGTDVAREEPHKPLRPTHFAFLFVEISWIE